MVPLPTQDERRDILIVHFKDKKISPDVDVDVVARGTPGMAGADLANLVNEAALFAVRRGDHQIHGNDFDDARDRVLDGSAATVDRDERSSRASTPRTTRRATRWRRTCSSTPTRCTR